MPVIIEPTVGEPSTAGQVVMTEAGFAAMRAEEGATIVEADGRYWVQTVRGFYQPVHQIARFRATEVRRPTWKCWGYRAALAPGESHLADGAMPVHVMSDLSGFTDRSFDRRRRRDLKKSRQVVDIRVVSNPDALVGDGWLVYASSMRRRAAEPMAKAAYQRMMIKRAPDPRRHIVAGFVDGKMAGYLESYAVDGTWYGRDLYLQTEMLPTGIATGLYFEMIQAAVRARSIREICVGPAWLERPGLADFKESLGFAIVALPARISMPAIVEAFIRRRRPAIHYRLTGGRPGSRGGYRSPPS